MPKEIIDRALDQARTIMKYPRSPLSTKIAASVILRWERRQNTSARCRR